MTEKDNNAARYAEECLRAGRTPEEVKQHLLLVGWSEDDAARAIIDALVALGAPRPAYIRTTGWRLASTVEVVLNFFSFILLGTVAVSLGVLYYQIINKFFPDPLAVRYYYDGHFSIHAIHYSIASLIVAFPIYVATLFLWFKRFRENTDRMESKLTKWLTYLVLLVAAIMVIGDLIVALFYFLQGELTLRFFLKAMVILVIAGAIFGFYFLERRKIQYKQDIPRKIFQLFGWAVTAFVFLGIVLGFVVGGSPMTERKRKFDMQRVNDLRGMASCISVFSKDRKRLPASLDELLENSGTANCGMYMTDPGTNVPYEYHIITPMAKNGSVVTAEFELCAVFDLASSNRGTGARSIDYFDKWSDHSEGHECDRKVVTLSREETIPPKH